MAFRRLLGIGIVLLVLGVAAWIVLAIDEETDSPYADPGISQDT